MVNRREVLTGAAGAMVGIGFVGCSLMGAAPAHAQTRRREVVVSGKRIKTVDVHCHCSMPEAMALMSARSPARRAAVCDGRGPHPGDGRAGHRCRGAQHQSLLVQGRARPRARQLIKLQNEKLAEFCAAHQERFVAFATVALQHPDLAVEQLVYGVKTLGLRGVSVGGSVNGEELAAENFHPVWAKAEELGVLVFLHPQGTAELHGRLAAMAVSTTSSATRSRPRSRSRI